MKALRFSKDAQADLTEIASYTLLSWGEAQAIRYVEQIERACYRLSKRPGLGRACDPISPGLRRFECGKHAIFYSKGDSGILVVRVLHQAMLPDERYFQDRLL